MIDAATTIAASRVEYDAWTRLRDTYRAMAVLLVDDAELDPAGLAVLGDEAEAITLVVRNASAGLRAARLTGVPQSAAIRELWEASARCAAEVAGLNAALRQRVRVRRDVVDEQLRALHVSRAALQTYTGTTRETERGCGCRV